VVDLEGDSLVTDDTQMTMFTLEGVIRAHHRMRHTGSADLVPVLQHAYQRWLHTQKTEWDKARGPWSTLESPDGWLITNQALFRTQAPGLTCVTALQSFGASGQFGTFARPVNNSKGCGGLMRTAPLALWSDDVKVVFEVAAMSAALTHGHPTGFLAAGTFAVLVHQLLRGSSLRSAIDIAIAQLVGWPGHEETLVAVRQALELAELGSPSPTRVEQLGAGAVSESALAIALYAALVTNDPNEALLIAVNHGGDSDSTASVCGNLVGAMYATDALRQDWVERVQFAEVIDRLATDALAEFGTTPPDWGTRYPPS
jgi:ADP-ribosylglycohydrolase